MELPSQSGLCSPTFVDSDDDDSPSRAQLRKSNKPLLEKKRRARINQSLDQLKGLVLDALKKDSARYSKLEKADILEMTVKHLRETQRQQMSAAMAVDPTVVDKYHSGFGECAHEVQRYLGSIDGLSSDVRMRLMQHLGNCMNQVSPYPAAMPPLYGVPCASPAQSLPGMSMRCGLPYGGLAMSSQRSPTVPISPSSLYSTGDYPTDAVFTPKSHLREHQSSMKCENSENIAPIRPLSEKTNNAYQMNFSRDIQSRDQGDNNNNIYPPAAKRQRLDMRQDHIAPNNIRNNNLQNKNINQNYLDQQIKVEPVWRPW